MELGYCIIAILYLTLAVSEVKLTKVAFWVYIGLTVVYLGLSMDAKIFGRELK